MKSKQCQFHPTSQANISGLRSHKAYFMLDFDPQDIVFQTIYHNKCFDQILFFRYFVFSFFIFAFWITVGLIQLQS